MVDKLPKTKEKGLEEHPKVRFQRDKKAAASKSKKAAKKSKK